MKKIIAIITVLAMVMALVLVAAPVSAAGAVKYGFNLSGAVMPVPPYGSQDIPGSDTASKLIVNQPNGKVVANMTGVMNGLAPNTTYTVYLSNGYTPAVFTGWNVSGTFGVNVELSGTNNPETLVLTQLGTAITGFSLNTVPVAAVSAFTIISGSVAGNAVTFTASYNPNPSETTTFIGTIASDGSISGTWADNPGFLGRNGNWNTTSGAAMKTWSGTTGWPGLFTNTIQPFTFTTDGSGAGSWHINMTAADFPGVGGTYTLSVWINVNGATLLISDNFQLSVAPTLAFSTGLNSDGNPLSGSLASGFTIKIGGGTSMHVLMLANPVATPALADGNYAFTLQAKKAQQNTLMTYFAAQGWTNPAWLPQIDQEINGSQPFFFLNAAGGVYSLVDNFKLTEGLPPTLLTINDNYPTGTYTYTGVLTGTNSATLPVAVTLIVTK